MKKNIIGKTGSGKSKRCFDFANAYSGTVVYFSGTPIAEHHYQKSADYFGFHDFVTLPHERTTALKDGTKYFYCAPPRKSFPAAILFDGESKNDFTREVTNPMLLILDDGFNYGSDKFVNEFLLLSEAKSDVIITAMSWDDLLPGIPGKKAKAICTRLGWEVEDPFPLQDSNIESKA